MSKFDVTQVLTGLDDKPLKFKDEEGERDLDLRQVLVQAALHVDQECPMCRKPAEKMSNEKSMDLYLLAKKLRTQDTIELKAKEVTDLQERIGKRWENAIIIRAQAVDMLEHPLADDAKGEEDQPDEGE
jgi:hypothetical protein